MWAGFKVGVGWSHQKCRQCLYVFEDMQNKFMGSDFTPRTLSQYNQQRTDIETAPTKASMADLQTTFGVNGRSILSELWYFDITKQLPQDIMHVLLEGSVQYEVRFILQALFETGAVTLRQVNNDFLQLSLGYHDESNRPPPLRESVFNGQNSYKLKLTAEQARIFLKNLPFILHGYVPVDDLFYQLLLEIVLIVQICFSPVTSHKRMIKWQNLIKTHLQHFKHLFPNVNIIPKMYYMIHIPGQMLHLGPLVRHSCMRFEARHRYFKDLAPLQNFRNICLSLAERYEIDECANFSNDNPNHHPLFKTERIVGPTTKMTKDQVNAFYLMMDDAGLVVNVRLMEVFYVAKWVTLYGATYRPGKGCVIAFDASFVSKMPLFGQLERIIIAGGVVLFEYTPFRTLGFCRKVMAYELNTVANVSRNLTLSDRLLHYNIYTVVELSDKKYISIKYDLRDIIEQHVIGNNPLHT